MLAEKFRCAFEREWNERVQNRAERTKVACAFQKSTPWTRYMLGSDIEPLGFLQALGDSLKRRVSKNWYSLDCVFYRDKPNLIGSGTYPAGLDVIIEHENEEKVEEEMWKLLMWRAPLKVLMFYDYTEEDKARNPYHAQWLTEKLEELRSMAEQMHERWPEHRNNEYLLLVGCAPRRGEVPRWRAFTFDAFQWVEMH